jgi:hypothetical protein
MLWTRKFTSAEKEAATWYYMNRAFATPVTRTDETAEYAPTQFLAEAFRQHGYDGIMYASALGTGQNVALFDSNDARLRSCFVHEVKGIDVQFSSAMDSYDVPEEADDMT